MIDWHTRAYRPAGYGQVLLAFACYGSESHPTRPNEFIRWEYEVIEALNFDEEHELQVGWPATEASFWTRIPHPSNPHRSAP